MRWWTTSLRTLGTDFDVSLTGGDGRPVQLEVADAGPGAGGADVAKRGLSTADSTGLGLDIVRRAAIAAGGELEISSSTSGGMLVAVTLGVTHVDPPGRRSR
jgi:signal transduction histidine kinase